METVVVPIWALVLILLSIGLGLFGMTRKRGSRAEFASIALCVVSMLVGAFGFSVYVPVETQGCQKRCEQHYYVGIESRFLGLVRNGDCEVTPETCVMLLKDAPDSQVDGFLLKRLLADEGDALSALRDFRDMCVFTGGCSSFVMTLMDGVENINDEDEASKEVRRSDLLERWRRT